MESYYSVQVISHTRNIIVHSTIDCDLVRKILSYQATSKKCDLQEGLYVVGFIL